MYIKTAHSGGVSYSTLLKVIVYVYLNPMTGFVKKLRERFGSSAQIVLNAEAALTLILKSLPGREPGMIIGIDSRSSKRVEKLIDILGLKSQLYDGEKELIKLLDDHRLLAVIIPETYRALHARNRSKLHASKAVKILYQRSRRPKPLGLPHDIYLWETRGLPRSVSGTVVVSSLPEVNEAIKVDLMSKPYLPNTEFIREIYRTIRGFENRYRRIDKRPPKVMPRVLYDLYHDA